MMEPIIKAYMTELNTQIEGDVLKFCHSYGIDVDKERLMQALTDARKFYDEGYRDGKAAALAGIVRCKDCKHKRELNKGEKELFFEEVLICTCEDATPDGWNPVFPDHFCGCGERRGDDGCKE